VTATATGSALATPLAGGALASAIAPPLHPAMPADPAKLHKAAQDFEAMAIGQFLQPMFDTVDTGHSLFGGGSAEETWKPVMVQELGKQIAAHGGLGLAEPVYAAMLRIQEAHMQAGQGL
jgi:Rod binding domain-containing protein